MRTKTDYTTPPLNQFIGFGHLRDYAAEAWACAGVAEKIPGYKKGETLRLRVTNYKPKEKSLRV